MHFLLTTLKVVYLLTTLMPELMEDDTVEAISRRAKWDNDDYICRGHILNEDASGKKFFVSNFNNYKMVDSRPDMEQFNELLRILGQYTQHGLKMDESISVSSVIDKLPPSGKGPKDQSQYQGFGYYNNGMFMLNLNKVPDDSGSVYMSSSTVVNSSLWHARLRHVHHKRMLEMSKDDLIPAIDERIIHETTAPYTPQQNGVAEREVELLRELVPHKRNKTTPYELWYKERPNVSFLRVWSCRAVVRLLDPKRKTLGEKGIDNIFVGYAEHSKAYRFYVIEPNDSDDHSNDVPSETPKPRRGKRARKAKSYGSDFQLYLVEGSKDQIRSQYSYCYSIEKDPRTYSEAMQSRDATFWKEAIDDEVGSIMENNT
ncbi:zinc finger, CCHC-type containing protein [Tanacetum coccineum]